MAMGPVAAVGCSSVPKALYAARKKGDFLVVGLHSDNDVNAVRGQNQPIGRS